MKEEKPPGRAWRALAALSNVLEFLAALLAFIAQLAK